LGRRNVNPPRTPSGLIGAEFEFTLALLGDVAVAGVVVPAIVGDVLTGVVASDRALKLSPTVERALPTVPVPPLPGFPAIGNGTVPRPDTTDSGDPESNVGKTHGATPASCVVEFETAVNGCDPMPLARAGAAGT
jgi:hypothetical protein